MEVLESLMEGARVSPSLYNKNLSEDSLRSLFSVRLADKDF